MLRESKPKYIFVFIIILTFFVSQCIVSSRGQSGGNYNIQKSVMAGGGANISSGGAYTVTGTVGQSLTGNSSQNSPFNVQSGFWTPSAAPTAAAIILGGQVTNIEGLGVNKVKITLVDVFTNEIRTTYTDAKGNYHFTDVTVGMLYIITAERGRYSFAPSQQIINFSSEETPVNFTAIR